MSLDQQETFTQLVNENNALRDELSALKEDALTPSEVCFLAGIGEPKDHTFAWGCFCVRCEALRPKLKKISRRIASSG